MSNRPRSKLIHLLISKSIAEALLVAAIAVGFYFVTSNPDLRGVLDVANTETVNGWAVDQARPWTRVEVQLFIDNEFVADKTAAEFRPDVHRARRAEDDWHGFVFATPPLPAGEHEARVYALLPNATGTRRTLQLIEKPLRFRIEPKQTRLGFPSEKGGAR
jgi:hypothetical protein